MTAQLECDASGIMDREIYLDNNATTRPLPEVRTSMLHVLDEAFGNPSSAHSAGDRARTAMRRSRESVAELIGTDPSTLVFTSGATEANNLVIASIVHRSRGLERPRIITSSVEHSSILAACEHCRTLGVDVVIIPVHSDGQIDLDALDSALTSDTVLVSVQWANNETGVLQPIATIGDRCRRQGVLFHTDAAQVVGKLAIDISALSVDFLSLTAHKIHGPAGIGALHVRDPRTLVPLFHGGPQEGGFRAGTENLAGIVGFGTAARLRHSRQADVHQSLRELRDHFELRVLELVRDVVVNGNKGDRLCNTTNLRFTGIDGQALVARLDQCGVHCSQSSACTNLRPEPSYVLRGMGLSEDEAYSSVRFSVSEWNVLEDLEEAARIIADLCENLRAFRAQYRKPNVRLVEVV